MFLSCSHLLKKWCIRLIYWIHLFLFLNLLMLRSELGRFRLKFDLAISQPRSLGRCYGKPFRSSSMVDSPLHAISDIYRSRWMIECSNGSGWCLGTVDRMEHWMAFAFLILLQTCWFGFLFYLKSIGEKRLFRFQFKNKMQIRMHNK